MYTVWHVDKYFFYPMPHMPFTDFVVFPPGHGRSVTDFEVGTPMRRGYVVPMV